MMRQSSIGRFHGIARRTQNNEDTRSMAATSTASPVSFHSLATEGWFYVSMAVFSLFFCIAAFGPSIVYTERRLGTITPLIAVHGIAFFAWLLLFIVQAILARTRNLALHRRLGMWSATLAAALVVLGYQTTIAMARRGYDLSGDVGSRADPLAAMAFPLLDIFMFAALFLAAYLYRHRSAIHKRLMLLAVTGALMPSPVAHLTGHFAFFRDKGFLTPLILATFLATGAIYDRIEFRRIHPVSLWIALAIFLLDNLCFAVVMPSGGWHAFAAWLIR
jgi:hypothetical protein